MIAQKRIEAEVLRLEGLVQESHAGWSHAGTATIRAIRFQIDALRWVLEREPVSPTLLYLERPAGRNLTPHS